AAADRPCRRGDRMRRREFITLLGGAAAFVSTARAQQSPPPVIGFLSSMSRDPTAHLMDAFRKGLSQAGFAEGQNVAIEYRWADGRYDRLPALAAELVARNVAVIVASGGDPSALAAKAATKTIPVVFTATTTDPVQLGLVSSLGRPGGNVTGSNLFNSALNVKRLELVRELFPKGAVFGFLLNPSTPTAEADTNAMMAAASAVGQRIVVLHASAAGDFETAFATLVDQKTDALVVAADPFFATSRNQIVALTSRHSLPAVFSLREYATAGGLMSYGPSLADGYRLSGLYAGQILKGAKPADLPVQQPIK